MRITLQRVSKAICYVNNEIVGKIENGLLIFVGFAASDTFEILHYAVRKCLELRIFNDENGKMNKSVKDIQGSVLIISQFTLYANCKRGRRPDFTQSAPPEKAKELYEEFIQLLKKENITVQTGIFAAKMQIELVNEGPVTINLEL